MCLDYMFMVIENILELYVLTYIVLTYFYESFVDNYFNIFLYMVIYIYYLLLVFKIETLV